MFVVISYFLGCAALLAGVASQAFKFYFLLFVKSSRMFFQVGPKPKAQNMKFIFCIQFKLNIAFNLKDLIPSFTEQKSSERYSNFDIFHCTSFPSDWYVSV